MTNSACGGVLSLQRESEVIYTRQTQYCYKESPEGRGDSLSMSTGSKAKKATAALDLCIIVIYGKNALGCKGTHTPALKLPYSEQVLQSWITLQAP